jgi:hypothetical protein
MEYFATLSHLDLDIIYAEYDISFKINHEGDTKIKIESQISWHIL